MNDKAEVLECPGVYSITCHANGRIYIGSAINLARRHGEHLRMLKRGGHENAHLQRAWNKYGEDVFSWDALFYCDEVDLLSCEQKEIDAHSEQLGWRNLFNMNPCASSRLGSYPSEASRAKMSAHNTRPFTGRKHTDATKATLSARAKARWATPEGRAKMTGREVSPETRRKIGNANRGRRHTDETKRKISAAGKGRIVSEETRRKLGEASKGRRLGIPHTEETKRILSEKMKGRSFSEETRRKISEGVKAARRRKKDDLAALKAQE